MHEQQPEPGKARAPALSVRRLLRAKALSVDDSVSDRPLSLCQAERELLSKREQR
eukprot:jgi/Phyca11/507923/fgenesh2_kg.PHYCAscaffold_31_\